MAFFTLLVAGVGPYDDLSLLVAVIRNKPGNGCFRAVGVGYSRWIYSWDCWSHHVASSRRIYIAASLWCFYRRSRYNLVNEPAEVWIAPQVFRFYRSPGEPDLTGVTRRLQFSSKDGLLVYEI